jgi:tRNA threonylcarbamoyladenosine biosynthesis protein TsaE
MVNEMSITTHSAGETARLGQALGVLLNMGHVVLLSGQLGAGKTTFSKGIAKGLGVVEEVTSPTFTIVAEYEGRIPLAHMDLYRLYGENGEAPDIGSLLDQIGWEDYIEGDYAVLVEWPAGVAAQVADALHVDISTAPLPRVDERVFHCKATGPNSWAVLDEWVKKWLF